MVVVASVMFGVPMPNSSSDLTDEVEPALLSQVPKIADQVCDGMLVTSAAVPLKYRDGPRRPTRCGRLYQAYFSLGLAIKRCPGPHDQSGTTFLDFQNFTFARTHSAHPLYPILFIRCHCGFLNPIPRPNRLRRDRHF